ncbi:MAG: hypothetical protein Kow00114_01860 [Kiloniellaceae bacterium]
MTARLTFRTDAAGDIGFGHLRRCLTLAKIAAARGHAVTFLLSEASDGTAAALLQGVAGIARVAGDGRPAAETAVLARRPAAPCDVLIADIAHGRVLAERAALPDYLRALHGKARGLAVLEGLGGDAITGEADGIAELIVTPYAFDPAATPRPKTSRQLIGAGYAILDGAYAEATDSRPIAAQGRRVLVTTGGSDPAAVAPRVLAACEAVAAAALEIRVVVGPYFAPALRAELARLAAASRHAVSLIESPDDLRAEMLWCDLAVSTSGLTKYELAATGTPAILLSHDAAHAHNNRAFAALGTAQDLGEADALSAAALSAAIARLLADRVARETMARRGRQTVDGQGAARIVDAIEDLIPKEAIPS